MGADRRIKLALVCASGGHFEQMLNLSEFYGRYSHFWVTNANVQTQNSLPGEKTYFIKMAHFKRPWTYFNQVPGCTRLFLKERPTHIVSTGSGRIAFLPFLFSKILRVPFIHIETFSYVNGLTKLGKALSVLGHPVYTQWRSPRKTNALYIGPIIKMESPPVARQKKAEHVFVTLGTRREAFPRIIKAVETLVRDGLIRERVIVQAGHTRYTSDILEIFDFCPQRKIDELIYDAAYVISQESAGIGTKCLKYQTRLIVMPREYAQGELPAKSDMNEDLHLQLEQLGFARVVRDVDGLRNAILDLAVLKIGFPFDNTPAIAKLRGIVEATTSR